MKGDAVTVLRKYLVQRFGLEFDSRQLPELKSALGEVLMKIKESVLQSSVVSLSQVEMALSALSSSLADEASKKVIDVIGSFDMPRFHYDTVRKTFHAVRHERSKFGTADEKAEMLRARYDLLLQRLQRLPAFQTTSTHQAAANRMDDEDNETTEIVTIESLMGQGQKRSECAHSGAPMSVLRGRLLPRLSCSRSPSHFSLPPFLLLLQSARSASSVSCAS